MKWHIIRPLYWIIFVYFFIWLLHAQTYVHSISFHTLSRITSSFLIVLLTSTRLDLLWLVQISEYLKTHFNNFHPPAFIQIHITPNITPPPIFHDEYKCIHSPNHYFFPSTATAASTSSSLSFLALTFTFWILLLLLLSLSICIAACFSSSVIVSNT